MSMESTPKERRRYALLQASAVIMAAEGRIGSDQSVIDVIDWVAMALAEIEKREKEEEDRLLRR